MSKVTVVGNAIVVKSSAKLEDIKLVQKYKPEVLTILDEESEPVFAVTTTTGVGEVGKYGIAFGKATQDDEKLACVTLISQGEVDGDIKEYVVNQIGSALVNLNKIEEKIPQAVTEIKRERDAVMNTITIA